MKNSFLLLILSVFISCNNSNNFPVSRADIYKGSEGIIMNFIQNAPPADIQEGQQFTVGVTLRNRGAYKNAGGILLIGYEDNYLDLVNTNRLD